MGFMAGFGKGFSDSFESAQSRRAVEKQDAFRVAYDSYSSKRKEYDADKKADEAAIRSAKAIVAGVPSAPEAAWKHAYELIRTGMTPDQVEERLRMAKFSPIVAPTTEAVQTPELDTQMADSGLGVAPVDPSAQPVDLMTPQQAPQPDQQGNVLSDMAANIFGKGSMFDKDANSQRKADRASSQVMSAAGVSQEEFDSVNVGYTPEEYSPEVSITGAKADTGDVYKTFNLDTGTLDNIRLGLAETQAKMFANSSDPTKQALAEEFMSILPDLRNIAKEEAAGDGTAPLMEQKDVFVVLNQAKGITDLYLTQKSGAIALADQVKDLSTFVSNNPTVLTKTGAAVGAFEALRREALTALDTAVQMLDANPEKNNDGTLVKLIEDRVTKFDNNISEEMASAQSQFNSKIIRMVLAAAKAEGISGNGFSNKEFDNIKRMLVSSSSEPSFIENLKTYMKEKLDAVETQRAISVSDQPLIRAMSNDENGQFTDALKPLLTPIKDVEELKDIQEWLYGTQTDPTAQTGAVGSSPDTTNGDLGTTAPEPANTLVEGTTGDRVTVTPNLVAKYPELEGVKTIIVHKNPDGSGRIEIVE